MKGDHTKFFGSQQYEMNTKFGSYLQSTTCLSLFCIQSNIESAVLVCPISEIIWVALSKELVSVFEKNLATPSNHQN